MRVSVIVPCYNYAHYLTDAINSLVGGPTCLGEMNAQTFGDFEIIIVDDASTDNTLEVAKQLSEQHEHVRYFRTKDNLGTADALNAGIKMADSKYITVVSADDMCEPWHLEQFVKTLKANPHKVIYNDIRAFADDKRLKTYKLPDYNFDNLLYKAGFGAALMYERAAWVETGGYPPEMRYGREDWAFGIALGEHGYCGIKADGPPGYLYRRGEHNRTRRNSTPEWRQRFRNQLMGLFPHLYRGERPMGCCGGGRNTASRKARARQLAGLPGVGGMVVLEYIGGNTGTETFFTPTGNRYQFGNNAKKKTGYVAKEDVPHMVGLRDKRRRIFRVFKPKRALNLTAQQIEKVNPGTAKRRRGRKASPVSGNGKIAHQKAPERELAQVVDEGVIIVPETPSESEPGFIKIDEFQDGTAVYVPAPESTAGPDGVLDKDELLTLASVVIAPVELNATSAARKLAREQGVNLADVTGTGKGGRIKLSDVREALALA